MVAQGIGLHDLHGLQLFQPGLAGYLVLPLVGIVLQMAHIGDVAHVAHLVAEVAQKFEEHIVGHSRPCMPEVGVAVDRGAAHVHAHMSRMHRHEKLLLVGKGIRQSEIFHILKT